MVNKLQPSNPLPPHPLPPKNFNTKELPTVIIQQTLYRLSSVEFPSSIYFDRSGYGRFDSPTQGYGILYVGMDVHTSWIECYGRALGARGIAESDIKKRSLYFIDSDRELILTDLTGGNLTKIGADARLSSGDYAIAREWGRAIHQHPQQVDGMRYRSRHDDDRYCYGLFNRCEQSIREENLGNLVDSHPVLLGEILAHYDYGLL